MHETGRSACLQRAPVGRKRGYSLQPTGRYSAVNSKRSTATNRDSSVSAHESSKRHFTKCLFFAVRNTSPCQTDGGTSGGYSSSQNCRWADARERQGQGKEYGGANPPSRAAGTTSVGQPWERPGRIQREHRGKQVRCGGTATQVTLGKHQRAISALREERIEL